MIPDVPAESNPRSKVIREAVALLALAACILGVHSSHLAGPLPLTAHHDNLDGAAPLRIEAARQWTHGHIPLWNPYKRAGMPLAADTTAGALYPGNAPFLWMQFPQGAGGAGDAAALRTDAGSPFRTMDVVAVLHALLAGLFMYVFLGAIRLERPARVFGALVFACSGTMGWFAAWYIQIQNSAVWLPLILAAVHLASSDSHDLARPADDPARRAGNPARRATWIAVGAFAVALQWLAGFPELSFYSGLIAVAYSASLLGGERRFKPVTAVLSIYVAGMLLAAVQLLPALELESLSRRPGSLSLEVFQSLAATPSMVLGWIVPSTASGMEFPPAAAYHFGAAAVAAALAGLFSRTRIALFFVLLMITGFLLSIGDATPVSAWAWHVPLLSAFRHPFKHLFELSFAVAGLSALGASKVLAFAPSARWPRVAIATAIVATAISLRINEAPLIAGNPANADISGARPAIAADLDPGARVLTPRHFFLKRDPSFLLGDYATEFEVPAVHGAGPYLWSELAAATGMVEEEVTFRRGFFAASDRTLALLSCPYVIQTRRGEAFWPPLDAAVYRIASEYPDARLARRDDALARFRFVSSVRCGNAAEIDASLQTGAPDPAVTALVPCEGSVLPPAPITVIASTPKVVDERPGHVVLETGVPPGANAFLVVSQADLPGWHATTDGKDAAIRRVHGLVQGIEIPGGTSRVELDYWPRTFAIGAATSAATALLLLVVIALSAARRGRHARGS